MTFKAGRHSSVCCKYFFMVLPTHCKMTYNIFCSFLKHINNLFSLLPFPQPPLTLYLCLGSPRCFFPLTQALFSIWKIHVFSPIQLLKNRVKMNENCEITSLHQSKSERYCMWLGEHASFTRQCPCDQMNKQNEKNSSSKQVVSGLIYMETVTSESESHMTLWQPRHS